MIDQLNRLDEDIFALVLGGVAIALVFLVVITAIVADTIRKVSQTKAREQSRREIAAYVAEGSITPDDATKLLTAGGTLKDLLSRKLG